MLCNDIFGDPSLAMNLMDHNLDRQQTRNQKDRSPGQVPIFSGSGPSGIWTHFLIVHLTLNSQSLEYETFNSIHTLEAMEVISTLHFDTWTYQPMDLDWT